MSFTKRNMGGENVNYLEDEEDCDCKKLLEQLTQDLQLVTGRVGKAKERIDAANSELDKLIQKLKKVDGD